MCFHVRDPARLAHTKVPPCRWVVVVWEWVSGHTTVIILNPPHN